MIKTLKRFYSNVIAAASHVNPVELQEELRKHIESNEMMMDALFKLEQEKREFERAKINKLVALEQNRLASDKSKLSQVVKIEQDRLKYDKVKLSKLIAIEKKRLDTSKKQKCKMALLQEDFAKLRNDLDELKRIILSDNE